jgi:hypothetical protein
VDAVHNETLALLESRRGAARACFLAWAFLIGTGEAPGPLQCVRRLLQGDRLAIRRWRATVAGRLAGLSTARRAPRGLAVPPPPSR